MEVQQMGFVKQPSARYALEVLYGFILSDDCKMSWNEHVEAKQAYEYLLEQIGELEHYKVKVIKDKERTEQKRQLERLAAEVDSKQSTKEEAEKRPEPKEQPEQETEPELPTTPETGSKLPNIDTMNKAEERALIAAMQDVASRTKRRSPTQPPKLEPPKTEPPTVDPKSPRRT